jgi:adenylate cyclase
VDILVGERTAELCPDIVFSFVDRIQVKGKDEPIGVYQPLGLAANVSREQKEEIARFSLAYADYLLQDWELAVSKLEGLKQEFPEKKLYQVYLDRIQNLREQELAQNWDGVFRHTSK